MDQILPTESREIKLRIADAQGSGDSERIGEKHDERGTGILMGSTTGAHLIIHPLWRRLIVL